MNDIAVVIPTRNRADLTINAIRSVLDYAGSNLRLFVSDNSTNQADLQTLSQFCGDLSDARFTYLRPPQSLLMTEHWQWAMEQALQLSNLSHYIYLTDRSMFKPGELAKVIDLVRQHPDQVISYDWITIFDHLNPIFVEERGHTGRLIPVSAQRLLDLTSRSLIPNCLPRMMNNCSPRAVIEKIIQKFGNVFASISPDYNFCYRCLAVVDQILFYDAAAYVSYAIPRSNGVSAIGMTTAATEDFDSKLDLVNQSRSFATPEPGFETTVNYALHEYCLVKSEIHSNRFPELDLDQYFTRNASEAAVNQNPNLRKKMEALLKAHGHSRPVKRRLGELRSRLSLRTRAKKLIRFDWPTIPSQVGPFATVEAAINYANSVPLVDESAAYHLRMLRD